MNQTKSRAGQFSAVRALSVLLVILSGALQHATAAVHTILLDNFGTYTNSESLRAVWAGGTAELDTQAPGGGKAASHDGGEFNSRGDFSVRPNSIENLVFSVDLYDSATN